MELYLNKYLKLGIFIMIIPLMVFVNYQNKKSNIENCQLEMIKQIHGKVIYVGLDDNIARFYLIFTDSSRYIPAGMDFRYDIKAGDSLYKVPGEFTYYIYKECNPSNPVIIRDTIGCKNCKGFLW